MVKKIVMCLFCLGAVTAFAKAPDSVVRHDTSNNKNKVITATNPGDMNGFGMETGRTKNSPLDKWFVPKYVYKGTTISKNVVPIETRRPTHGIAACTAVRFHKHWISTAAHCIEPLRNTNGRVFADVRKQQNGLYILSFDQPSANRPANANFYFYKQGYSSDDSRRDFGHSEDIALIRLDSLDTMADTYTTFAQQKLGQVVGGEMAASMMKGKMNLQDSSYSEFLNQPLDDYHFFAISPNTVNELAGRSAQIFRFEGHKDGSRDWPKYATWDLVGAKKKSNHVLAWQPRTPTPASSGSPLIINGYIVSVASGPGEKGYRETPMYTHEFRKFLEKSMGSEYPEGLCILPKNATDKWKPKK